MTIIQKAVPTIGWDSFLYDGKENHEWQVWALGGS